jgi:hypothetical protein
LAVLSSRPPKRARQTWRFPPTLLLCEQPSRVPGEFEKLHALVHVGATGRLQRFDFPEAAVLLLAPLVRHAVSNNAASTKPPSLSTYIA